MDESTSALDPITEQEILKNWSQVAQSKVLIMVAHRRESLKLCDVIYEVINGEIHCVGSYAKLIEREGGETTNLPASN